MYQMKRGRSSAEIEAPFQLRVPLISTSLTNGDAHGHGSKCCSGRPWPTPRLFTVVVCVLIFGIMFTFLNIYELHKMRNAGNSSGFVDTSSKNGPVAWLHGKNMQSGYLKHVENVFQRVGYTVVTEEPGKWDAFWSHTYPFQVLKDEMKNTRGNQRVNHFPGSGFITNKVSLATLSSKYIPKAFQLPDEKQAALAYAKEFPEKMFVQKNNKHRGISVQKLGDIDLETPGNFVQEYVSDPFLIDGHKFDIGVYVALTSVDPLRVYVFEGDVLFRFCPEKYLPFDPVNLNKYVVGDDYLPVWKVPSLKKYFSEMGLGMRESFNAYLRSKGRTPETVWRDVKLAIQEIFLKKEPLFVNLISKYPYKEAFFEMMRFDFVLDEDLNPYLMEANMSPNLSSSHFPPNRFLYEQVLYNLFSLVGLARRIKSDTLSYRSDDEEKMEVSDKEISVFHSLCASEKCASSCHAVECKSSCVHCFTTHEKEELKRAYKEHLNRGECRRILPMPMHRSEAKKELEVGQGLLEKNEWMLRWFRGMCLKDPSWCQ